MTRPQPLMLLGCLFLTGCVDLLVQYYYPSSEILTRAKNGQIASGDVFPTDQSFQKLCLIRPGDSLADYASNDWPLNVADDYYLVLTVTPSGEETVERLHEDWIVLPSRTSICLSDGQEFFVLRVDGVQRAHLKVRDR